MYKDEQAIKSNMDPLWNDLCAALVNAVQSFNRYYRPDPKTPVKDHARKDELEFSCQLPLKGGVETVEYATATITLDRADPGIRCSYQNSKAAPVNLGFECENDHVFLFFLSPPGSKVKDVDHASQLLLGRFLFELNN